MKRLSFIILYLCAIDAFSQDCADKLSNAPGTWGKISRTERVPAAELAVQKKFIEAVHAEFQPAYTPRNLQIDPSFWHEPRQTIEPVYRYGAVYYAMHYSCSGGVLTLNHETSTSMRTSFNQLSAEIYGTSSDYILTGFHRLDRLLPVEVKPGIWAFPYQRVPLGFGLEGQSRFWLITYDGKLPWSYVTRKEFLLKRKENLQRQASEEEPRLKEQLASWEMHKKMQEQQTKNDPAKMEAFMKGTYNPAVEREKNNYRLAMEGWTKAIQRVETQLQAPESELAKQAIVVRSTSNFRDYDFIDKAEPPAEILIKPNPAYFNRNLGPSVPQFITVEILGDPKEPVASNFIQDVHKVIHLDYLKSFIGKSSPGAKPGNSGIQMTPPPGTSPVNNVSASPAPTVRGSAASTASSGPSTTTSAVSANVGTTTPAKDTKGQSVVTNPPATQSAPAKTTGKASKISGVLRAPVGLKITLVNNGGDELTVTPQKTDQMLIKSVPIAFAKPVADGNAYKVAVKNLPPNTRSAVYHGDGSAPSGADNVRIAVDYQFDLITRSSDDKVKSSFYESWAPAVGGYNEDEGRYVVFVSVAKNLEGSDGKFRQIFWRDRNTGITKMISRSATGEQANGDCNEPSISADGLSVVFESKATNLVTADNKNTKDIFLWRASTGTIDLVSASANGDAADGESFDAMISGNGQHVVFTSLANNLSATPKGRSVANVFVRDLQSAKTEMISVDPVAKAGGNGYKGSISFDGSRITFCSAANTLVPNDNNGLWDIYLFQRGQSALKRVSLTHDGKERNAGNESASRQVASSISGNGKFVAFATTASNMVPGDNNNFQDVFVVDVETGKVSIASTTPEGQPSNGDSPIEQGERIAITHDGSWVAFPTKATNLGTSPSNIVLHNTVTGKKQLVSDIKGTYVARPALSYSGSYLVFGKASNLDNRFSDAGIFAHFTGNGPSR